MMLGGPRAFSSVAIPSSSRATATPEASALGLSFCELVARSNAIR